MANHAHAFSNTPVLVFHEVEFEVVDVHSQPWLRGLQVASALGYQNPSADAQNLYNRNADEFDESMTQVVELNTAGGRQPVRIFSPRGAYLLAMLARTERAKEFRRWVLDVLEGHAAPKVGKTMTFPQHLAALKYRGQLVQSLAKATERGTAIELYSNLRHVSRLLGMTVSELEALAPALKQQQIEGV